MIHANQTRSKVHHITRLLLAALGILFSTTHQKLLAATDDVEFNECAQALDQNPGTLTADYWRKPPLDAKVAQLEDPDLYGDVVIRWMSHKNQNGSTTFAILTRDPEPQPESDPDGFDLFYEKDGHVSEKTGVGANGFAFSKESNKGVNGLMFCTLGNLSRLWVWTGNNWEVSK